MMGFATLYPSYVGWQATVHRKEARVGSCAIITYRFVPIKKQKSDLDEMPLNTGRVGSVGRQAAHSTKLIVAFARRQQVEGLARRFKTAMN